MGYVTREMIDQAKEMDLLTYLQTYEPQELVHLIRYNKLRKLKTA